MSIRIIRNNEGNCINFEGSSNPTYWNACLSGEVDGTDASLVNVRNDITTAQSSETQYEFFRIPYSEFRDEDGVAFADAQEVADYITLKGNVSAPEDINVGYKGTWDASLSAAPTYADPVNGDWFYIETAGTIDTVVYEVNDIIKYSETADEWNQVKSAFATVTELEASALDFYDHYVDGNYTGTIRTGSSIHPYNDLATAIAASNPYDTIFIEGVVSVPNSSTDAYILPHGLHFYGATESVIQFATYDATNGSLIQFTGTDNTQDFIFNNITIKNAGGYGINIEKALKVTLENCTLTNNGWNGLGLSTVAAAAGGDLGYDSTNTELQAFYAGVNASDGGAMRLEEVTQLLIIGNTITKNLRGLRVQDCGIGGGGFITRNQSTQNIDSGIYLAAGIAYGGCQSITVSMNVTAYNANNGLLTIGGINNKFSQNEVNGNWNAGFCAWGAANVTLRDCGLYDNNRTQYNGIGNTGDAKASIQVNEAYDLLGTQITVNPAFRFIAEILDTQVHYTGLGSNIQKVGFLISEDVGNLTDDTKNIIKVDDVGFIGQDYAIDLSEVDVSNLRLSFGDNSYQSIGLKAVKAPLAGNYSELPFSNHVMEVPEVDVVVDTLKQTIALHEGVGGNVINVYGMNELQSVLKTNSVDIIQKSSDRTQLRDCTLGNVYINGVVAGSNVNTMNDSLNAAFNMNLTEYKEFIETGVGVLSGAVNSAAFYYVESPDGTYHYPLFKTEDDANQVDTDLGGSGSSHTHTYVDDLTNTTWYMPDVSNHMNSSVMPVNGLYTAPNGETIESVVWNIQTTDDDANYLPTFSDITYSVQEGSAVNIQYKAAGMTDTFNITNVPTGYADDGFAIIGTAEDITNGAGNSIQHVINVTKANAFGSVNGTITINVLADLASNEFTIVEQTNGIKFTQDGTTTLDFNTVTFNAGSTYKFYLDHGSVESNDTLMVVDANGNAYTTGVTLNGTVGSTGAYLEFVVPSDVPPVSLVWTDGAGAATVTVPMTVAGSTYTANPTGITLEGPAANQTGSNVMDQYDHGWISLNETLAAGERLVLDNAFFTDFLGEVVGPSNIFAIGLKGDNWTNTKQVNNNQAAKTGVFFKGNIYIVGVCTSDGNQVNLQIISNGSVGSTMVINTAALQQTVCAFIDISGPGNNIKIGMGRNGSAGVTAGDESTVTYGNWNSYKGQTGEQGYGITNIDVVMSFWTYNGGDIDGAEIDWTGISEINIPTPPTTNATSFTKAIDFSGGNEHAKQKNNSTGLMPLATTSGSITLQHANGPGTTSSSAYANPWATAVVFQVPNNTSNQHIWNMGEGAANGDDNIYLRITGTNGELYLGWGREGSGYNELKILNIGGSYNQSTGQWYGIYIGFNGTRLSGNDATAASLADCFDVKLMGTNDVIPVFDTIYTLSTSNWTSTGARMDRAITGDFTIGGRGQNRSFHGKVASMVVTTLECGVAMPTDAEAKMMLTDPIGWVTDYKVGETFRSPPNTGLSYNFQVGGNTSSWATQVWQMGDGANDTYPSIMNYIDTNLAYAHTSMVMQNMQSNDIQNVTINGLS